MTENKRFIYCFEGIEDKWETAEEYKYTPCTKDGFQDLCVMLNELNDENEKLKQSYIQLKHRHSLLHDECLDAECDRDSYQKDVSSLENENERLKQEVTHWKKILDNHQQIVAKTLREQYHWLKNEDKISNNDKTVALLELESISERLGIDLI